MSSELDLWRYFEEREEQIISKRRALQEELEALREARASLERKHNSRNEAKDKMTIKEMIRAVLRRNPEGGTSDQIINWINQLHAAEVARTSLSPQLSRLKADGEVDLNEENGLWSLTSDRHALKRARAELGERQNLHSPARSIFDEHTRRR